MKVGDFVINRFHSLYRYGIIKEIKTNLKGDGWSYFDVDWVEDQEYQRVVKNIQKWSGREYEPQYYRADQIQKLDVDKTIQTLIKLQNSAE